MRQVRGAPEYLLYGKKGTIESRLTDLIGDRGRGRRGRGSLSSARSSRRAATGGSRWTSATASRVRLRVVRPAVPEEGGHGLAGGRVLPRRVVGLGCPSVIAGIPAAVRGPRANADRDLPLARPRAPARPAPVRAGPQVAAGGGGLRPARGDRLCRGHGRTGKTLAGLLVLQGLTPRGALRRVRRTYCDEAVESREHAEMLHRLA
jgi:hypothetical protein